MKVTSMGLLQDVRSLNCVSLHIQLHSKRKSLDGLVMFCLICITLKKVMVHLPNADAFNFIEKPKIEILDAADALMVFKSCIRNL